MFVLPNQLAIFQGIEETDLARRLDELPVLKFPKGFVIFEAGDPETDVLAILRGKVEIVGRTGTGELETVATLNEGHLFGEFSFFTGAPRTLAAVALEECAILVLKDAWLKAASDRFPSLQEHLQSIYRSRVLLNVLRSSKLFSALPPEALELPASKMELRTYEDGQEILAEGETSLELYVIKSGRVAVTKAKASGRVALQELGPADILGEMAIVTGQPRSASAHAVGRVEAMVLNGEEFRALLARYPVLLSAIENIVRNRSEQMRQALETVVADVLEEGWEKELDAGLRVADLNVEAEIEAAGEKTRGLLQEVSARSWKVGKAAHAPGELVRVSFAGGTQRFQQELKKIPPLDATTGAGTEGIGELRFGDDRGTLAHVANVVRILAGAKLKGLIFPRYEASEIAIDVRVARKGKKDLGGRLVSLSLTNARLQMNGECAVGEPSLLHFGRQGKPLAALRGIPLSIEGTEVEFQFEYDTSEEKTALGAIIRLLSKEITPIQIPRERAVVERASMTLERSFKTAAEFIRTYMTSIEAGILKVAAPKLLTAGTPVQVQLLIPGFPGVRKANCSGMVRSWSKGIGVVELPKGQPELQERLRALFEKLISLQTEKSWQERQKNLMLGTKYSVWEDRSMRTAIWGSLAAANAALYFWIYFVLARPA